MKPATFRRLINLWPPYLLNSIRVLSIADDWQAARVALYLRPWNRNIMRTQFGGNLFAMIDPIPMLLAMQQLGDRYHVWDRSAEVDFIAPGRSHVFASVDMPASAIEEIRAAAAGGEKVLRWFDIDIQHADGRPVAQIRKQLYVRLKSQHRAPSTAAAPT
ncbi:DUF4442 domain-containing protein [Frateuria aurantia]